MSDNPYRPKLVFTSEPFAKRVCELTLEKTTVGRGEHNTLVIQHPSVSHAHCEILVHGPEVIVRDLQSSNGTFIQGIQINSQAQVKHGQSVRFGDVTARLELAPQDFEPPTTEETAVHEHAHVLRERRREQTIPKPAGVAVKLESNLPDRTLCEQTVVLTRTAPRAVLPPQQEQRTPERPGATTPTRGMLLLLALAAMGLGIVLWLIFWR